MATGLTITRYGVDVQRLSNARAVVEGCMLWHDMHDADLTPLLHVSASVSKHMNRQVEPAQGHQTAFSAISMLRQLAAGQLAHSHILFVCICR